MFKAVLSDVSLLKDPMVSISEIIDEGTFRLTKEGIRFTAADRAMVSVADYFLSSSAFDSYDIDGEQKMGLNILNFLSVVKRAGSGDRITFELEDARLKVTIDGASRRKFSVPMLNLGDDDIPPIGQLEFKSKVVVKSDVMQNGIDDADIIGDSVIISVNPDSFSMLAEDDVKTAELELSKGSEALLEISASGDVRARYALDYLKKMMKGARMSDFVTIEHGSDYPMKIEFSADDKSRLSYILAPRVTES